MSFTSHMPSSDYITHHQGIGTLINQKICEDLLFVAIRHWLPSGMIDPIVLSYLVLVTISVCKKWKALCQDKIAHMLSGVTDIADAFFECVI